MKPVPSAEQASSSLKVDEFFLRILSPFSSRDLAFWRTRRTLFTFQDAFLEPFFEAVAVNASGDDTVYGAVGFVVKVNDCLPVSERAA